MEERRRLEEEKQTRIEAEHKDIEARRKSQAERLEPEGLDGARIALRLPDGRRIQRKFRPGATLQDVYFWADVAAHLPENREFQLQIPPKFSLWASFPARELTGDAVMSRTVEELQLAGTILRLAEIEEDGS